MSIKRQWAVVTAMVCLLVLVAGYLLLVHPEHKKVTSVKAQTASVGSQVQALKAQVASLMVEKRNQPTEEAELARIMQQLPTDPQLPTMLRALDAAAAKNQVELVNVAPGNPVAYVAPTTAVSPSVTATTSAPTTSTTTSSSGSTAVSGLADIPVVLTVSGNYYGIEGFLDSIEGLQRSMLVNSFALTYKQSSAPVSGDTATVGNGEISATINTEVFMTPAGSATAGGSTSTSTTSS